MKLVHVTVNVAYRGKTFRAHAPSWVHPAFLRSLVRSYRKHGYTKICPRRVK